MSQEPDISVIVVSRDRPDELRKMLACLRFQDISGFEVIVVTNTPNALDPFLQPSPLRVFDCDEANISVARNVGIFAAKGRYIAFCDDDALPDPGWLRYLLAPFEDPKIGGAGGFTRGRNGISLQWGAVETDTLGVAHPLDIDKNSDAVVFAPQANKAPVMIGTNCAFRASALHQIGGFDPAYAYFLDDSDISLSLAQAGWHLAIVPKAQVHHGFAEGPYRAQNRVPKTLEPHGKSKAYFCRKHGDEGALDLALTAFKSLQFKRLEKQLLAGLMEPSTLPALINSLEKGYTSGRHYKMIERENRPKPSAESAPDISRSETTHVMLVGRNSDAEWMQTLGETLSENNIMVTALLLSRSLSFLQVGFSVSGFWQHTGGQYGKSSRDEKFFHRLSFREKVYSEIKRLETTRPVNLLVFPDRIDLKDIILPQTGGMTSINGYVVESAELWQTLD